MTMRVRLRLSLFVIARVAAPSAAQLVVDPPAEHKPCPKGEPSDDKRPCGESAENAPPAISGVGAGAGSGAGAGGGSGGAEARKNLGGEMVDGVVCAIDRPFVVHMQTRPATFDIKFEPADEARGMWTYAYDI